MRGDERRYNEKEVRKILRLAAERQAGLSGDNLDGLTIAELQRVAAEVNIDPACVQAAADDLEATEEARGSTTLFHLEEEIEGEIDDIAWESIVAQVRTTLGVPGETSKLGAAYEWTTKSEPGATVHLSASPRNGRTSIRLMCEYGQALFFAWTLTGMACLMSALILGKLLTKANAPTSLVAVGVVALILGIATIALVASRAWQRAHRRKLKSLCKRIASSIAQPSVHSAAAMAGECSDPVTHPARA